MLEERNKADFAAIREIMNQYVATLEAGDFDRWISLWTDNGIQMPPGAPARVGKGQISAGMKPAFDLFNMKVTIDNEETRVTGNWGFARGTGVEALTPKAGGKTEELDVKYLTILEKQTDGSWKIARDCFNSNKPET